MAPGRPVQASASTTASTTADPDFDRMYEERYKKHEEEKDARKAAHWQRWLPYAGEGRATWVIVFDQSPDDIMADLKRIAGPNTKYLKVSRVAPLFDFLDPDAKRNPDGSRDLSPVEVAIVGGAVYDKISDKYEMTEIYVKLAEGDRMARVPVARKARRGIPSDNED